jgi:hypothetical protein
MSTDHRLYVLTSIRPDVYHLIVRKYISERYVSAESGPDTNQ